MTRATSIAVLVAMVILLATGAVPPQATSFFCQVVGTGSRTLVRLVDHTVEFSLLLAGLALLIVLALSRATWRPAAPVGVRQRRAAVWCAPDRCRRRLTAGQLSLPDSDRCVGWPVAGPSSPHRRARGRLHPRRAPPERPPRSDEMVEGLVADRRRRSGRARRRPARRCTAHPRDRPTVLARQRRRRSRLRRHDAVRRPHD